MCNKYFPLMKHSDIENIFDDIYEIRGSMRLFKVFGYARNMTILKDGDDLILINPVRVDGETEKRLMDI